MNQHVYALALIAAAAASQTACRSAEVEPRSLEPPWNAGRVEMVVWKADDPSFDQSFAIEASGLAVSGDVLVVPSEKYSRLLLVDVSNGAQARVVRLAVPAHAELEGVALFAGGALLCDEAHAAVYLVPFEGGRFPTELTAAGSAPVTALDLEGVDVRGGKVGFEGIEVDPENGTVLLLLERSGTETTGCVSRIWRLQRTAATLASVQAPTEVQLEDCAWRLTGLAWWDHRLVALKTQFPGERYEVVTVDLDSGKTGVLINLTELLRSLAGQGWSNNVEGIAVADDGSLWLVADNAVTGVIDNPLPPPGTARTLLLRLPPSR